jgi:competence protein ComEA
MQPPSKSTDSRVSPQARVLLAGALLATVLAALGLMALREVVARPPPLAIDLPTPTPLPAQIVVHVAGEVANPGVYTLSPDTRLHEAIQAAGGPTEDANLDAVNLAARVSDGLRYYIPRRGQTGGVPAAPSPPGGATIATPINVNTATVAELDTIPGIGPVTAGAIVAYRQEHGPFQSLEDLLEVPDIGPATLERLRPYLTVS